MTVALAIAVVLLAAAAGCVGAGVLFLTQRAQLAFGFVAAMALVREPVRLRLNAILVAAAGGVYLSGGLGIWELVYPAALLPVVYLALDRLRLRVLARFGRTRVATHPAHAA